MNLDDIRARHASAQPGPYHYVIGDIDLDEHHTGYYSCLSPHEDDGTDAFAFGVDSSLDEDPSQQEQDTFQFLAHSWADVAYLLSRVAELESKLPMTADGALVEECDVLYCPRCDQAVRAEYDVAYCDTCVNPDDGDTCNSPPLPLMFGQCLSKPKEKS